MPPRLAIVGGAAATAASAGAPQPATPGPDGGVDLPAPAESGGLVPAPRPRPAPTTGTWRLSPALLSFLVLVGLPTIIAGIYYGLIATDQYVAEFRFGLRSPQPLHADGGMTLQGSSAPLQTIVDSYAVAQYIDSRAILDDLGKTLNLRKIFSNPAADWWARLRPPVTIEELVLYWQRQVDAFFDPTNGTIVVRTRAFTPTDAMALAREVLASSERLVNELSARARRDTLRNSEADVKTAEHRLTAALVRLRDYRDAAGLIDPHKAADANAALAGRLREEMVRADTSLSVLREYMSDDAPTLKLLIARIAALKAEQGAIESEATDTATTHKEALSQVLRSYEELESERRFAETAYQHALEALDRARIDADRQQIYVADFVPPSLPEEALYPRRLRSVALVFVAALVIWGIGNLTIRSVWDHL